MRFKTSQTTPSYLDRRFQWRMLSFVALISSIMFVLSFMNRRPESGGAARSAATATPESLVYEVQRDTPVLKPDEVIVVANAANNEPRGQLADGAGSSRTDSDADDKEMFQRRSQERTRNDKFFTRRPIPSTKTIPVAEVVEDRLPEDLTQKGPPPHDDFAIEDDRSNGQPSSSRPYKAPSRTAPPVDDDWISTPGSKDSGFTTSPARTKNEKDDIGKSEFDQDEQPPREPPIFNDQPSQSDSLFNDDQQPFRSNKSDDDSFTSPRTIHERNDHVRKAPVGKRRVKSRPSDEFETESPPASREPFSSFGNSGPRRDRRQDKASDNEPFREDSASARIDKRYLDLVKDNTLGVRNDEAEVFYWLVDHARRVSSTSLERWGAAEVQYVNLMTEPDRYRGELITIEGDLWRLYEIDAGANDYGVNRLYEAWVFTGDSGNHPYRIVCTGLAKGIQPAENLRKPVRITGYFFKREGYRSNGGVHVAPTLVAHRIDINPSPNGIPLTAGIVPYMTGAVMAIALALLVTIVGFAISDERSSRGVLQKVHGHHHVAFADLHFETEIPVEESLRELAERERESTLSGAYGPLLTRQAVREHAAHNDATSLQRRIGDEHRQFQQETAALHDWALKQNAKQQELNSFQKSKFVELADNGASFDELSSDTLSPARRTVVHQPEAIDEAKPTATLPAANPVINLPKPILPPPVPPEVVAPRSPTVIQTSPQPQPYAQTSTNSAYSASKLFEWENEVERLNSRGLPEDSFGTMFTLTPAAANRAERERLERERLAREAHERERVEQQRDENERLAYERGSNRANTDRDQRAAS